MELKRAVRKLEDGLEKKCMSKSIRNMPQVRAENKRGSNRILADLIDNMSMKGGEKEARCKQKQDPMVSLMKLVFILYPTWKVSLLGLAVHTSPFSKG